VRFLSVGGFFNAHLLNRPERRAPKILCRSGQGPGTQESMDCAKVGRRVYTRWMKGKTTERNDADMAYGTEKCAQMSGRIGWERLNGRRNRNRV